MKHHWCIIVDRFYPEVSGIGNSSLTLAEALVRYGCPVTVLTTRSSGSWRSSEILNGIRIRRIGGRFSERSGMLAPLFYGHFFLYGLFLLQFIIKPDVVLGQTAWEGGLLSAAAGIINRKRRSLVHIHGGMTFANRHLFLARIALRYNKVILATNRSYSDDVRRIIPGVKPVIARNIFTPLPADTPRQALRAEFKLDNARFHLMCIGRMVFERGEETKGFSYAIRAAAWVSGVTLHLFGDGNSRTGLEQLGRQLGAPVVFHGRVSPETIARFMPAVDCFLLSSINEGLSMSMIEAMAYRLPVIATSTAGALDIIENGKNGILVPPADAESIADAIRQIIDNRKLRAMLAKNAFETYRNEFNEHFVLRQYLLAAGE